MDSLTGSLIDLLRRIDSCIDSQTRSVTNSLTYVFERKTCSKFESGAYSRGGFNRIISVFSKFIFIVMLMFLYLQRASRIASLYTRLFYEKVIYKKVVLKKLRKFSTGFLIAKKVDKFIYI